MINHYKIFPFARQITIIIIIFTIIVIIIIIIILLLLSHCILLFTLR